MGKKKVKCLLNHFKDMCFDYKYNINNGSDKNQKHLYLEQVSSSHSKVLEELLRLKRKNDEKYSTLIISTINQLMNFSLYTRDKYYGLESYEMFEVQFINYCHYLFEGLIHIQNITLLLKCVVERQKDEQNIGSYYDLKCLARAMINELYSLEHPVFKIIYTIFSEQIKKDVNLMSQERFSEISYCAKWIPREKSGSSWMVPYIVKNIFNLNYRKCSRQKYYNCLKRYRICVSELNKHLDTPEIKMCANTWSEIDLSKTSSLFMKKYYTNFTQLRSEFDSDDRKQSMVNFKNYLKQKVYHQMYRNNGSDYIDKIHFTNYQTIDFETIMNILSDNTERPVYNQLFISYLFE